MSRRRIPCDVSGPLTGFALILSLVALLSILG